MKKWNWNNGMMEDWNNGVEGNFQHSSIPIFQLSYTYGAHKAKMYYFPYQDCFGQQ
jgi:hypothetical protein